VDGRASLFQLALLTTVAVVRRLPFRRRPCVRARAIQERLRTLVVRRDRLGRVRFVAGVDVGFENDGRVTRAAVAVLRLTDLAVVDSAVVRRVTRFPYVPGYLSFREIPAVLAALNRLSIEPELLVCDGQGIAHPRRVGLASHLGLVTDIPSIGAAKSILVGMHAAVPRRRGSWRPLIDSDEVIGAALRTRDGVKPMYVSIGHRISLATAINYVLRLTPMYRLPETTRWAHRLASG
jgi:deoxyribonuclease V